MNPFGFDINEVSTDTGIGNLTAGTYEVVVSDVIHAIKPKNGNRVVVQNAQPTSEYVCEIQLALVGAQNGFGEGWKHTLFLRPFADNEISQRIAKAHLRQIVEASGIDINTFTDSTQLIGKVFMIDLVQQKNNPEYTNLSKAYSVENAKQKSTDTPNESDESNGMPKW